jgi:hypothetical protein
VKLSRICVALLLMLFGAGVVCAQNEPSTAPASAPKQTASATHATPPPQRADAPQDVPLAENKPGPHGLAPIEPVRQPKCHTAEFRSNQWGPEPLADAEPGPTPTP